MKQWSLEADVITYNTTISACTKASIVCDHTSLRVPLLHLPKRADSCDPLLTLLAYANGGTVCGHISLHVPMLRLPRQAYSCNLPLAPLAYADGGAVCDQSSLHVSLLRLPKQAYGCDPLLGFSQGLMVALYVVTSTFMSHRCILRS